MPPATLDPRDVDAALRLAEGTPSTDPRRTHAARLVRACGIEPPREWVAAVCAPAAWHLVASVLGVAAEGTVIEHSEHSGGQHQDIVIWNRDQERWPLLFLTWTSGALRSDNDPRPLDRDYVTAFITNRAALEQSLRRRLSAVPPEANGDRVAAARLVALLTEPPRALELRPSDSVAVVDEWVLSDPVTGIEIAVAMSTGGVRFADGAEMGAEAIVGGFAASGESARTYLRQLIGPA